MKREAIHTDSAQPTVLVTGASSGIGSACVGLLRRQGYSIVGVSRRSPDVGAAPNGEAHGSVLHLYADLTTEAGTRSVVRYMFESRDRLRLVGLVNCAGAGSFSALDVIDIADLRRIFELNFFSVVSLTTQLFPLLRANAGRIINIGSTSGRIPRPFTGAYSASKAALESFTRTLRMEAGDGAVRVVMIEPGVVDTPFWKSMRPVGDGMRNVEAGMKRVEDGRQVVVDVGQGAGAGCGSPAEGGRSSASIKALRGMSPDVVAGVVLQVLRADRPGSRYVVGADARRALLLDRILPHWASDWLRSSALRR